MSNHGIYSWYLVDISICKPHANAILGYQIWLPQEGNWPWLAKPTKATRSLFPGFISRVLSWGLPSPPSIGYQIHHTACLAHWQTVAVVDTNSHPKHPPLTYPGPVGMGIRYLHPLWYEALWFNLAVLICLSWLHGRSCHVCGLWIDDSCVDLNPLGVMANFIHKGSHST